MRGDLRAKQLDKINVQLSFITDIKTNSKFGNLSAMFVPCHHTSTDYARIIEQRALLVGWDPIPPPDLPRHDSNP